MEPAWSDDTASVTVTNPMDPQWPKGDRRDHQEDVTYSNHIPWRIHGGQDVYIYLYEWLVSMEKLVGKYTSPMDAMGMDTLPETNIFAPEWLEY